MDALRRTRRQQLAPRRDLASLVTDAAARRPDSPALIAPDRTLSYESMALEVGQLHSTLAAVGLRRGDRVGVNLHKSVRCSVAIQAIFQAGGVHVPLNLFAPATTNADILTQCGATVLITDDPLRAAADEIGRTWRAERRATIGLSEPVAGLAANHSWAEVASADVSTPVSVLGDDLAYIIHTSGSTGTPKGIMHTHRSGSRYAELAAETFALGPGDRMADCPPSHVDMSTLQTLAGVHAGAATVVVPDAYLKFPASLAELLEKTAATTIYAVPSLLQPLIERGGLAQRDLKTLRWILVAGEAFTPGLVRDLMDAAPSAALGNVYGPAEVNQCTHWVFSEPPADGDAIPIGRAWADTELRVVDENDDDVARGERGELLVRTGTMMAGYWDQPDLTDAGCLIETGPGATSHRWYRTGDIVWERPDGELVFAGRRDNQVKVRGNRVELEAVETAVASLPGITDAVVGVHGEAMSSQLVAWVTRDGDPWPEPLDSRTLRGWQDALRHGLPSHAIPATFVGVPDFPRQSGGKLDRRSVRAIIRSGDTPA